MGRSCSENEKVIYERSGGALIEVSSFHVTHQTKATKQFHHQWQSIFFVNVRNIISLVWVEAHINCRTPSVYNYSNDNLRINKITLKSFRLHKYTPFSFLFYVVG